MDVHNCNLNIHYSAPDPIWDELGYLYKQMPHWNGGDNGKPCWYGGDNEKLIEVSVEPSGLSFYAKLPQDEWNQWFDLFKEKATEIMGYQVGEPEDGFDFVIYDE
ncbi:hypothetical protein IGJ55_002036 [Enterococcus sp. AZ170]|uniref:hypothetical protein n=1 Tax=unclassified Enterococcus TaxID=2608891 RepID=UPI003D2726E9